MAFIDSAFLQGVHHAYAQTDGTYAWPNSREGDLLREGKNEIERLRRENAELRWCVKCTRLDTTPAYTRNVGGKQR